MNEWLEACRAAESRAAEQACDKHGVTLVRGYSNLGVPIIVCPKCSPWAVQNGQRPVREFAL